MKNLAVFIKNSASYVATLTSTFIGIFSSFLSLYILSDKLSNDDFGRFYTITGFVAFSSVLFKTPLFNRLNFFSAQRNDGKLNRYHNRIYKIYFSVILSLFSIYCFFVTPIYLKIIGVIWEYESNMPFLFLGFILFQTLSLEFARSTQQFYIYQAEVLIRSFIFILTITIDNSLSLITAVQYAGLSYSCSTILALFLTNSRSEQQSWKDFKNSGGWRVGMNMYKAQLLGHTFTQADGLLIPIFLESKEVGIYKVLRSLINISTTPGKIFVDVNFVKLGNSEYIKRLIFHLSILAALIILSLFITFEVLSSHLRYPFANIRDYLIVISTVIVFSSIINLLNSVHTLSGNHHIILKYAISTGFFSLMSYTFFPWQFGLTGAITSIAINSFYSLCFWFYIKKIGL